MAKVVGCINHGGGGGGGWPASKRPDQAAWCKVLPLLLLLLFVLGEGALDGNGLGQISWPRNCESSWWWLSPSSERASKSFPLTPTGFAARQQQADAAAIRPSGRPAKQWKFNSDATTTRKHALVRAAPRSQRSSSDSAHGIGNWPRRRRPQQHSLASELSRRRRRLLISRHQQRHQQIARPPLLLLPLLDSIGFALHLELIPLALMRLPLRLPPSLPDNKLAS